MKYQKDIILLVVVFCLLTWLTSCAPEAKGAQMQENEDEVGENILADEMIVGYNALNTADLIQYHKGYLYFYIGSTMSGSSLDTFYRYNVSSGSLTTVCADPLCLHNEKSCPFYAMGKHFALSDYGVIYTREFPFGIDRKTNRDPFYELVNYDVEKLHMKQYAAKQGMREKAYTLELYTGQYRFYYDAVKDEKTKNYYFSLCRMNLNDGSVVVLKENASAEKGLAAISGHSMANIMLFAVNGKIYFNNGGEIYSTYFDLENKEVILTGRFTTDQICTDGEYIYWGERETDGSGVLTLYRANLDGSGKTALGIQAYRFTVTKKYIYYENTESTTLGEDKGSGKTLTKVGTALCRASHDGSGQETVFSFVQDDTFYEFGYTCYAGDHAYVIYKSYSDTDGDGVMEDGEIFHSYDPKTYTLLRVDLNTGKMDFIRCGTENRETP